MRKNLLLLLLFCAFTVAKAQNEPAITLTAETGSQVNLSLGFMVSQENTKLFIDWGDGTKVETPVIQVTSEDVNPTEVSGKPLGAGVVKIYGEGITKFEAICDFNYDMNASEPKLTDLDVSKAAELISLSVTGNSLASLDVHKNTKLTKLTCSKNNLTSLGLPDNVLLERLDCSDNKINSLGIANCVKLTSLVCNLNKIASLDLTKYPDLTNLNLMSNKLSELDFSNTPKLTYISVNANGLSALDVSVCTQLGSLFCMNNKLTSLKVSTIKTRLSSSGNKLTLADLPSLQLSKPANYAYAPQAAMEIPVEIEIGTALDLSAQTNLKGIEKEAQTTVFTWKKADGEALVAGTDYTENEGVFKFLKAFDAVYCEMTTPAFPAFTGTKAFKTTEMKVLVGATSIDNANSDSAMVYTESGKLFIKGLAGTETVNVFNLQGINVASAVANDAVMMLPLNAGQYIVVIDNVAHKAVVR